MASPPATTPPYDSGEYILQVARARVADAGISLAGNLLADTQPYTIQYLNNAIRDVQTALADRGVETFPNEIVLSALPVSATHDPAIFNWISYANFNDGVNLWATAGWLLPQDLLIPVRMWERTSGTNGTLIPMKPVNDGLPARPKTSFLRQWEWRDDKIYLVGSLVSNDVRIRYSRIIPDVNNLANPVPLLRCSSLLAWHIAHEFALPRGGTAAVNFKAMYDEELMNVALRSARKQQRHNNRRIPYDRGGVWPGIYASGGY